MSHIKISFLVISEYSNSEVICKPLEIRNSIEVRKDREISFLTPSYYLCNEDVYAMRSSDNALRNFNYFMSSNIFASKMIIDFL